MNATVTGRKNSDPWGAQQSFHRIYRSINDGVYTHRNIHDSDVAALNNIAAILHAEHHRMLTSDTMFDKEDVAIRVEQLVAAISDTALSSDGWDVPYVLEK